MTITVKSAVNNSAFEVPTTASDFNPLKARVEALERSHEFLAEKLAGVADLERQMAGAYRKIEELTRAQLLAEQRVLNALDRANRAEQKVEAMELSTVALGRIANAAEESNRLIRKTSDDTGRFVYPPREQLSGPDSLGG